MTTLRAWIARQVEEDARGTVILRGAMVLAALAAAVLIGLAGSGGLLGFVVILCLSVAAAALPDTPLPLTAIAAIVLAWVAATPDRPSSGGMLLAGAIAVCCLVIHCASALLAVLPPQAVLPAAMTRRWSVRSAILVAVTVLGSLLAAGLAGGAGAGNRWLSLAAVVLATGWALAGYLRTVRSPADS